MLKKLLKHELHATGRYMWIVYVVLTLFTAVGLVITSVLGSRLDTLEDESVLMLVFILFMGLWIMAIGAAMVLTLALMVHRFYKNFLSDEGYLMFTLPVSLHELLWSKLLVAILWQCLTALVAVGGIVLGVVCIVSGISEADPLVSSFAIADYFADMGLNGPVAAVEIAVSLLIGAATGMLQFYCVMSIGFGFAKNKALFSVLIYLAIQTGLSVLSGASSVVGMILENNGLFADTMMDISFGQQWHLTMLGSIALSVVMGAVYYVVTAWNLRKRLNLA